MKENVDYNSTHKMLHWLPVFLIAVQFPLGWLMKPTGRDEIPTAAVNLHFSIGVLILIVLTVRLGWKLLHPVGMEPSLPHWQYRAHAGYRAKTTRTQALNRTVRACRRKDTWRRKG